MTGKRTLSAVLIATVLVAFGAMAAEYIIAQKDKEFSRTAIDVTRGDTIMFTNNDTVIHHLYIDVPGFKFDSAEQPPGKNVPIRFNNVGRFPVRCAIHPKMQVVVTVRE